MIAEQPTAPVAAQGPPRGPRLREGVRRALSPRNASALYVFVAIFVIFSLWVPDTFLAETTWRTLLDSQSITALVAVALVVPLAAGAFNLLTAHSGRPTSAPSPGPSAACSSSARTSTRSSRRSA